MKTIDSRLSNAQKLLAAVIAVDSKKYCVCKPVKFSFIGQAEEKSDKPKTRSGTIYFFPIKGKPKIAKRCFCCHKPFHPEDIRIVENEIS